MSDKKGGRGFKELMYRGKPVIKSGGYTKVDLILCKNQPKAGSYFRLDMRYKVNKDFCAKCFPFPSPLSELTMGLEE